MTLPILLSSCFACNLRRLRKEFKLPLFPSFGINRFKAEKCKAFVSKFGMEPADLSNNNFQLSKPIFVILKLKMNLNDDCQFWRNSSSVLVFVNKPRVDVKLLHLQTHGIFQVCFTILHQAFMFGVFYFCTAESEGSGFRGFSFVHDDHMGFSSLKQTCNDDIILHSLSFVNVLWLHK